MTTDLPFTPAIITSPHGLLFPFPPFQTRPLTDGCRIPDGLRDPRPYSHSQPPRQARFDAYGDDLDFGLSEVTELLRRYAAVG